MRSRMSAGEEEPNQWIERRAKLLEAGEYPDKGVTISAENLAALAASFKRPVPVLIEHGESALQLGQLTQVEALGKELFGTVRLTKEANSLLRASEARSLSLGLTPDLREIREVSVVKRPRVAGAQLFSVAGSASERDVEESGSREGVVSAEFAKLGELRSPSDETDWQGQFEALSSSNRKAEAQRAVDGFVREGRLCPAQAPYAEALLEREDVIEFDGDSKPLRQLLIAMIERQPPMALFSALVPEPDLASQATSALMLPEEAAFYRKHFPDVSLEEIALRRR